MFAEIQHLLLETGEGAESGGQRAKGRERKSEVGSQKSEVGSQKSEDRVVEVVGVVGVPRALVTGHWENLKIGY